MKRSLGGVLATIAAMGARVGKTFARTRAFGVGMGDTRGAQENRAKWPLFEQIFGWLPARMGEPPHEPKRRRHVRRARPKKAQHGVSTASLCMRRVRKLQPGLVAIAKDREAQRDGEK